MFNALPLLQPKLKAGPMLKPDGEAEMDMEVVHEIAPKAKILVYDFNWDAAVKHNDSMQTIWSQWLALETRIVKENPGAIVSESIGGCEGEVGVALAYAYKQLYDEADALGESVFVSSGDDAAYDCLQDADRGTAPSSDFLTVDFPASVPSLTAVGGTRLSVATDKSWLNETVWEDPAETVGSGGGISAFFSRPSWQKGPGVQDPRLNPANMRSVPDVSADADPDSGVAVYGVEGSSSKPAWSQGGGTSQAAPIWAGMTALIDEYLKHQGLSHPVGFMNPALYTIASDRAHYPLPSFHDVTMGNNLYYSATPGYDMASGLGTPDAYNLARSLATYERGGG
jgi:kumamolisin